MRRPISAYTKTVLRRMAQGERLFVRHEWQVPYMFIGTDEWNEVEEIDDHQMRIDLSEFYGEVMERDVLKWTFIRGSTVHNDSDCVIDEYTLTQEGLSFLENKEGLIGEEHNA